MEANNRFDQLVKIVKILRKECPWDRKQTHESIKDNLIEEAYEAVDAIDQNDFDELKKELGDLMLHVVFHANMASETDYFEIEDVIYTIQDKLIRRHPHVFGEVEVKDEQEVARNWESIKLSEGKESVLDGIPRHLPALIRAQRMQEKAANVGFDWPDSEQVIEKIEEEVEELQQSLKTGERNEQKSEFGDLLFSLVNISRFYNMDAEDCLRMTNKKFEKRFRYIENCLQQEGKSWKDTSLDEMDAYWNKAKMNPDELE